ncbi:MFS transporter [Athalassotoga saccharophila]|uniref:MFS transporter n=1 Tax=Athalassotoga saccharophila TaxID=1441386 RepID=UPI00137AAD55|nr:MFS transporter [Athalassotoga saccharophila]BBJ28624.1 drug resistance transporter [Athalassotoga saccharophila]
MKKQNTVLLLLFIFGIFMGAIDSGIVSPARVIIGNSFGIDQSLGIWMITLYTLIYAASMPIMGKLGDRRGYKKIFIIGIIIFGIGSFLSGMNNFFGNFWLFLLSRSIQALGAGGMVPIATTAVSKIFPEEKKGTALGIVGGVYGIATIVGPTIGSFILSIAGTDKWGWLFFINVPISILVILLSLTVKEIEIEKASKKLDITGSILLAASIGSLMYALTNLDFFNLSNSIRDLNVYPFLIAFAVLFPLMLLFESKNEDPVFNTKFLTNPNTFFIMMTALVVGIGMMGLIFIPQFAENILKLPAGTGGYVVTLLAIFSGIAAPLSGILVDRRGAVFVMSIGFVFNIAGALFLGYVTTYMLNFAGLLIGLFMMGIGIGFTLGAPLNYMILKSVDSENSASALANLSLMRSIGVTVAPNVMVGFLVQAGKGLQTNLTQTLSNAGIKIPPIKMDSQAANAFASLQNADVTNIVTKLEDVLNKVIPFPLNKLVVNDVQGVKDKIQQTFQSTINTGYTEMFLTTAIISLIGLIFVLMVGKLKSPVVTGAKEILEEKIQD